VPSVEPRLVFFVYNKFRVWARPAGLRDRSSIPVSTELSRPIVEIVRRLNGTPYLSRKKVFCSVITEGKT